MQVRDRRCAVAAAASASAEHVLHRSRQIFCQYSRHNLSSRFMFMQQHHVGKLLVCPCCKEQNVNDDEVIEGGTPNALLFELGYEVSGGDDVKSNI